MKSLILILISLFLGFWQGSRLKKRKLKNEIVMLNKKIEELNATIDDITYKNRLSMFDSRYQKKYDRTYLEERLTEYITSTSEHVEVCYTYISVISYIVQDVNTMINKENFKSQIDLLLNDFQYLQVIPSMKIKNNLGFTNKPIDQCIMNVDTFFQDMKIENYCITYQDCYDAILVVLEAIGV